MVFLSLQHEFLSFTLYNISEEKSSFTATHCFPIQVFDKYRQKSTRKGGRRMNADVSLTFRFGHPVEQVWQALTDAELLEKWIWDNDFKPIQTREFQFRAEPNEWWDGIVNGKVLKVEE